ncbi:MAG: DNA methyltransferase [Nanoarchaeota archaeon]
MQEYVFILGRNPDLSVLEIVSYLNKNKINYNLPEYNEFLAILQLPDLNFNELIKNFGGTVKIGKLIGLNNLMIDKNKITYSVSSYKSDKYTIIKILKNKFKEEGIKATIRYSTSRELTPSQSLMLDLEFFSYKNKLFQIIAVSNPKSYRERDEKRPIFDPLKVISIRLAKILINLSEAEYEILDPFCGTGTILQEALLMNLNAIGSDINIQEAKKNLIWLGNKYKDKWKLITCNATKISNQLNSVECIVTEPYMGPYIKSILKREEIQNIIKELNILYDATLKELSKIVKKRIVIIIPFFKSQNQHLYTNFDKFISKYIFRIYSPLKEIKVPIKYTFKDKRIKRLIYVLEKI